MTGSVKTLKSFALLDSLAIQASDKPDFLKDKEGDEPAQDKTETPDEQEVAEEKPGNIPAGPEWQPTGIEDMQMLNTANGTALCYIVKDANNQGSNWKAITGIQGQPSQVTEHVTLDQAQRAAEERLLGGKTFAEPPPPQEMGDDSADDAIGNHAEPDGDEVDCEKCDGTGTVDEEPCEVCGGTGLVEPEEKPASATSVLDRYAIHAGAPIGNQNASGHHDRNMLRQNLSELESDFDKTHGVSMAGPNSWRSDKHKLYGYSTARQLRNAIKKKINASDHSPSPSVHASGTSEGVRKSWITREANASAHAATRAEIPAELHEHFDKAHSLSGKAEDWKSHEEAADAHYAVAEKLEEHAENDRSLRKHVAGHYAKAHEHYAKSQELYPQTNAKEAVESGEVHASGTSEGAKKGWSTRIQGGVTHHHMRGEKGDYFVHQVSDRDGAGFKHRWTVGMIGKNMLPDSSVGGVHDSSAAAKKVCEDHDCGTAKASDPSQPDTVQASAADPKQVVHCRDAGIVLNASEKWECDKPVNFQWMPGGVHTIVATYDSSPIELTVQCDAQTSRTVQASFEAWLKKYPKQKPFGCVEHREEEAAILPESFAWKQEPEPGIFCSATATELGARNVNGRIHRSWSPSFTTDADYAKSVTSSGTRTFPEGVRGSRSNPASITGVAFSVGSLTNKPAFKAILPVRAKEAQKATPQTKPAKQASEILASFAASYNPTAASILNALGTQATGQSSK